MKKYQNKEHLQMLFREITEMRSKYNPNVDKYGAQALSDTNQTPDGRFRFLVGLLLSSQTQDPVTARAVVRLDKFLPAEKPLTITEIERIQQYDVDSIAMHETHNLTLENVRKSNVEAIAQILKPVGFFNQKAKNMKKIAEQIDDVPDTIEELVKLPGIGMKMSTIIMKLCYNKITGIAVDTHMHRICQKLGLAGKKDLSATAQQVQSDLESWVPKDMWTDFNHLIVGFGQVWCQAKKPKCDECTIAKWCYK